MNPNYIVRTTFELVEAYRARPEESQVETAQAFTFRILLPPLSFHSLPVTEQLHIQALEQFSEGVVGNNNNNKNKNKNTGGSQKIDQGREVMGVVTKNNNRSGTVKEMTHVSRNKSRKGRPSPEEVEFIGELVAGICLHYEICQGLFVGFCNGFRRSTTQDREAIILISYLLIHRFEELGPSIIFPMMVATNIPTIRLTELIAFISSPEMMQHATVLWNKVVQDEFIDDFLIPTLEHSGRAMQDSIPQLRVSSQTEDNTNNKTGKSEVIVNEEDHHNDVDEVKDVVLLESPSHMNDSNVGKNIPTAVASKRVITLSPSCINESSIDSKQRKLYEHSPTKLHALPPAEVRDMIHTLDISKNLPPVLKIKEATAEERRAVEAAKYGVKLSTLSKETRSKNRRREASKPFFHYTNADLPLKSQRLAQEYEERQQGSLRPVIVVPSVDEVKRRLENISNVVSYKTTEAAIRREKLLLDKKRAAEEAELAEKIQNLHDDTEFEQWKAMAQEKDEADRLLKVKERKLNMTLADEEARQARLKQQEKNQKVIKVFKDKMNKNREVHQREVRNELNQRAEKAVEQRVTMAQELSEAISMNKRKNAEAALKIKQQQQEQIARMAVDMENERNRKVKLINEIKKSQKESAEMRKQIKLELQRKNYETFHTFSFDEDDENTTGLNARMLSTMSIADLRRYYDLQMKERASLIEAKRHTIKQEKEREKETIMQMQREIETRREELRAERETRRMEKKERKEKEKDLARSEDEKRIFELQKKLDDKRNQRKAEQARIKEEEKKRIFKAQFLANDTETVEKRNIESIDKSAENTVIRAQNQRLRDKQLKRAISASEVAIREANYNNYYNTALAKRQMSDVIQERKRTALESEEAVVSVLRKQLVDRIRQEHSGGFAENRELYSR